jgi:hypothetical protein
MNRLCKIAIVVGLGNYFFYAAAAALWGDALHGHLTQGHYILGAGNNAVEIGRTLFYICKLQAYSLLVTFPLLLLGASFLSPPSRETEEEFTGGSSHARLSPHSA